MNKSNLELFKQALNEGVSNRFDAMAAECTDTIECSEHHTRAIETIVYGKTEFKRTCSSKKRRLIALLVAAALLLTGCGILFRHEIREIFEDLYVKLTYGDEGAAAGNKIEDVYQLGYVPEGYSLRYERIRLVRVQYEFQNQDGEYIWFDQRPIDTTNYVVDTESGYSKINEIDGYEVYYRYTNGRHVFVWNDGTCSMRLSSSAALSNDEIILILEGITVK